MNEDGTSDEAAALEVREDCLLTIPPADGLARGTGAIDLPVNGTDTPPALPPAGGGAADLDDDGDGAEGALPVFGIRGLSCDLETSPHMVSMLSR